MKPEEITYETESISRTFTKNLREVHDSESFDDFLDEWRWCFEEEVIRLNGSDWPWIKPLLDEMKEEDVFPEEKHMIPMKLAMPEVLFAVIIIQLNLIYPKVLYSIIFGK